MRRKVELQIITETIEKLIPGAIPACMSVEVKEKLSVTGSVSNVWTGSPAGLAERIATALYGRLDTTTPVSPLAQAEDAKRARDLEGEIGALMAAERELTSAPWYPVRPGDLVHAHYARERAGHTPTPAYGETYIISAAAEPGGPAGGLLGMQLLAHTLPDTVDGVEGLTGCFAVEAADDPIYELWFEVGSHLLTIVRDGQVVHGGGAK
ncbi:hypothetical protein [Streptomyces graminilatus]|uniref:hypothetical protein n=1 Tax=Streptomyces graminilatus TaxID=1464070 RepID=UPI0006E170C4|nr:hypothetical protein [Streptomyces graminilatus]